MDLDLLEGSCSESFDSDSEEEVASWTQHATSTGNVHVFTNSKQNPYKYKKQDPAGRTFDQNRLFI